MFSTVSAICLLGFAAARYIQPPPRPPHLFGEPVILFPPNAPAPPNPFHLELPPRGTEPGWPELFPPRPEMTPWHNLKIHDAPSSPQPALWPFVEVVPTPPENSFPYPPFPDFLEYPWFPKPEVRRHDSDSVW
ncbi:hypothetical protein V3C99_017377 [Haemonchus contortus]|nr:unnamed protein product [Haemonchus contortus]